MKFGVDWHRNIFRMEPEEVPWQPDVILASPPCEVFSVASGPSIRQNWTIDTQPKSPRAMLAIELVKRTLYLIDRLEPVYFIIENPRGLLRTLPILRHLERRTVSYCQYGAKWMKPTDLWGRFPPSLRLRPMCKRGDSCHERVPHGSKRGLNGERSPALRAEIPEQLAHAVMEACCRDLSAVATFSQFG
jgi:hypothetical protein